MAVRSGHAEGDHRDAHNVEFRGRLVEMGRADPAVRDAQGTDQPLRRLPPSLTALRASSRFKYS